MMSPLALLSYLVLTAALLFGGAARRDAPSDFIPELLAIPLLVMALPAAIRRLRDDPLTAAVLAGLLAVVLISLLPLPSAIWTSLPGRDVAIASYDAAEMSAPFLPVSMQPREALKGGLALIPAISLFLAVLSLSSSARRVLLGVALAVGVVSLPLGILQIMGGKGNALYFFDITNHGRAVGFFANANHYAAFFYALIPLSVAAFAKNGQVQAIPYWVIMAALIVVFILGLSISGSRSALLLGFLSLVLSGYFLMRGSLRPMLRGRRAWVIALSAAAMVVAVALGMGLSLIIGRFDASEAGEDARWSLYAGTWPLIWKYFPIGAGLGTFERLYQIYAPESPGGGQVANHAHNDYLEVAMETGLLGLALLSLFFVWLVVKSRFALQRSSSFEGRLAIAAVIVITLLSLHSAWDYPLRTIALSSLMAICAAFLFEAQPEIEPQKLSSKSRHRRRRRVIALP